jgi:hypothetical protein
LLADDESQTIFDPTIVVEEEEVYVQSTGTVTTILDDGSYMNSEIDGAQDDPSVFSAFSYYYTENSASLIYTGDDSATDG